MYTDETEAETRADRIDPALAAAGWGVVEGSRVRREMICPGRIIGGGKRANPLSSDYVLIYRGQKLATIEAKKASLGHTEGLGQAKDYAARLKTRFAYSTNGIGWYEIDMETGREGDIVPFPSPDELWRRCFVAENDWRDRFGAVPFETGGGKWELRYYQHNAINAALEAVAAGRDRILLTLATGTGKTSIAFQIAWKLFNASWNLSREPLRRPRILFLADRNFLADQAYNAFSAFPSDAITRVDPDRIRKKGGVPKNASIFVTIFQTFMTGEGEPNYQDYPPDFFDFIIVDECHRGGAKDESEWRGILEYFSPAVQLGLTATPKRKANVDTYAYFGEPVYTYALREGIEDGFLTPFKVRQMASTIDEYVYDPSDTVIRGEIEIDRKYAEADFNTKIEIDARERSRVAEFMGQINQRQKTLVFCATQDHAARVRDYINQIKDSTDPNYCERVTADDGKLGEEHLRAFQDNEKTIPTILTTSQKLSTGVDARNIRNIVLMRPIRSMIEFKQIIGRGTRTFDGKDFFTIYDFVKAYEHFNDPEWDGEPLEPVERKLREPKPGGGFEDEPGGEWEGPDGPEDPPPPERIVVRLADGKDRRIQYVAATTYWSPEGRPITAHQFLERLFGDLSGIVGSEHELRDIWSKPDARQHFLTVLQEKGYDAGKLDEMARLIDAPDSDIFDVLAYVRFTLEPKTRHERVEAVTGGDLSGYEAQMREFLSGVLAAYERDGIEELALDKMGSFLQVKYGSMADAKRALGDVQGIRAAFIEVQKALFAN
ncbi:MAG: EcoAI/FtnUII family type I restriction enzme subunit R [Pseudomonadota bacterium]